MAKARWTRTTKFNDWKKTLSRDDKEAIQALTPPTPEKENQTVSLRKSIVPRILQDANMTQPRADRPNILGVSRKPLPKTTIGKVGALPRPTKAPDNKKESDTLASFKQKYGKGLKGKRVTVCDGKWRGKEGTFDSWNGKNAYIQLDIIGKKAICLSRTISV
eukprot:TRINITY_DN2486_c0_g1_i1.p1 TRINITY_DN2486_c0_g1~~TRINITY_DN2486_c0_g1_i1.p1  ORF type:complete len:162 (-),score=36.57 TRINITY_DN2486_c0_g1_i1:74-559(-)